MGESHIEVRKYDNKSVYWKTKQKNTQGSIKTKMGGQGKNESHENFRKTRIEDSEDRERWRGVVEAAMVLNGL